MRLANDPLSSEQLAAWSDVPLFNTVTKRDPTSATKLIENGAVDDPKQNCGRLQWAHIYAAILGSRVKVVKALLKKNLHQSLEIKIGEYGEKSLCVAAWKGKMAAAWVLILARALMEVVDDCRPFLLHAAC